MWYLRCWHELQHLKASPFWPPAQSVRFDKASLSRLSIDVLIDLEILIISINMKLSELPGAQFLSKHDIELFEGPVLGLWKTKVGPDQSEETEL
jgi:hypothetical protein